MCCIFITLLFFTNQRQVLSLSNTYTGRHNGNIYIDNKGRLIHMDFGYLLSKTIKFEKAPFKLTEEFIEVMGGSESEGFRKFVRYCIEGFLAVRKNYENILLFLEMSTISENMGKKETIIND